MNLFAKFAKDESGATAIEYGLIAALMAVVVIAAIAIIGPAIETNFNSIATTLTSADESTVGMGGSGGTGETTGN